MKVLIVVASKHGSTHEIAQALRNAVQGAHIAVGILDLAKGETADVRNYEAVILGSAIYAGTWLPAAKHFAQQHREALASVPLWLFSSGPLGADNPQPPAAPEKLAAALGQVNVRAHHVFGGKLEAAQLGLDERLLVQMVQVPAGDFRDWAEVRDWGREIAGQLQAEGGAVKTPR